MPRNRGGYDQSTQNNGSLLNFNTYQPVHVGRPIDELEGMMKALSDKNTAIADKVDAVDLSLDNRILGPGDEYLRDEAKQRVRTGLNQIMDSGDYSFIEGKVKRIANDVTGDQALRAGEARYGQYLEGMKNLDAGRAAGRYNEEMYQQKRRQEFTKTTHNEQGQYDLLYQFDTPMAKIDVSDKLRTMTNSIKPEELARRGIETQYKNNDPSSNEIEYFVIDGGSKRFISKSEIQTILSEYVDSDVELNTYLKSYYDAYMSNRGKTKVDVSDDVRDSETQYNDNDYKKFKQNLISPYAKAGAYNEDLSRTEVGNLAQIASASQARKVAMQDAAPSGYNIYEQTRNNEDVTFTLGNVMPDGTRTNVNGTKRNRTKLDDKLATHKVIIPSIALGVGMILPSFTYDRTDDANKRTLANRWAYEVYDYNHDAIVTDDNKEELNNITKSLYGEDVTFDKLYKSKDLTDAVARFQKSPNLKDIDLKISSDGSRIVATPSLSERLRLGKNKDGSNRSTREVPLNEILNESQLNEVKAITTEINKRISSVVSTYDSRDTDIANTVATRYSNIKEDNSKMSQVEFRTNALFGTTSKAEEAQIVKQGTKFLNTDTGEIINAATFQGLLGESKGKVEVIGDYGYQNNFVEMSGSDAFSEGELVTLDGKQYAMSTEAGSQDKGAFETSKTSHSIYRTNKYEGVPTKLNYNLLPNSTVESEKTNANGRTYTVNVGEEDRNSYIRTLANIAVDNELSGTSKENVKEYVNLVNQYLSNPDMLFDIISASDINIQTEEGNINISNFVDNNGFKITTKSEENLVRLLNATYQESYNIVRKYNNIQ